MSGRSARMPSRTGKRLHMRACQELADLMLAADAEGCLCKHAFDFGDCCRELTDSLCA